MKIAINGFGRIGRCFYRANNDELNIIAANDLGDKEQLKYLLKYDTVYGKNDNKNTPEFFTEPDPVKLPWKEMGVDIVIESTGRFTKKNDAKVHLDAGASKVVISAPSDDADIMIVPGVNEEMYNFEKHNVISMGSCTTNCLAPIAYILNKELTIKKGWMTTIHSYTADQNLVDGTHKSDVRRGRCASSNIIPTSTGAAKAIYKVIPELEGKLNGIALRVPTPTVSVVEFICEVEKNTTKSEVNKLFKKYADDKMKGILSICFEPLVSSDYRGSIFSSIVDAELTDVMGNNLIHVTAWYDNEMGYSHRLVDLCKIISKGIYGK